MIMAGWWVVVSLTGRAWGRIEPLLPPVAGRAGGGGITAGDQRDPLEVAHRGAVADLPERYGSWKTADERLPIWTADGTWERILGEVIVEDDSIGVVECAARPRPSGRLPGPTSPDRVCSSAEVRPGSTSPPGRRASSGRRPERGTVRET